LASQDGWVVHTFRWCIHRWEHFLTIFGGAGVTLVELLPQVYPSGMALHGTLTRAAAAFWISILSVVAGQIIALKKSNEIDTLKARLAEYEKDYPQSIEEQLKALATVLKLGANERISLYKFDEDDTFARLGRYSINTEYNKAGRVSYPAKEGAINKAWYGDGFYFVDNLPDPNTDLETYLQRLKEEFGINKNVARDFKMKSRCYAAYAINNTKRDKRIAIIVIESINADGLGRDRLKAVLDTESPRIARIMERLASVEPSPALARKEEF
jgi:hypothetical protein